MGPKHNTQWVCILIAIIVSTVCGCVGFEKTAYAPNSVKSSTQSNHVSITDFVLVQDDVDDCMKCGVRVDSVWMRMRYGIVSEWTAADMLGGSTWWVRNVNCEVSCPGARHLHDIDIRYRMIDNVGVPYYDSTHVLFYPVHPGAYNEIHFTTLQRISMEVEITPGFDGDL